MRIDMKDVVWEFCEDVTLTRSVSQVMSKGKYESDIENTSTIRVAIVPLEGRQLELLPEGARNFGGVSIYSLCELLTVSTSECKSPDIITSCDGNKYQVQAVSPWFSEGGYYECVASRVNR